MKEIIKDRNLLEERVDEAILQDEEQIKKDQEDLKEVLKEYKDLPCLCGPQIGIKSRIICLNFDDGARTFFNPMIKKSKGIVLSRESNPCLEGKEYIIPRRQEIEVIYQTPTGKIEENVFKGGASCLFQQMLDLLDGILLDDLGLELVEGWDDAPEEERQEVIEYYLDNLKKYNENMQEIINSDEKLSHMSKSIDYTSLLLAGKLNLYTEDMEEIKLNREQRRKLEKQNKKLRSLRDATRV